MEDEYVLKTRYITAGALIRGSIKRLFREVEMLGGTVTYNEHKGLFESTFTHVEIRGPYNLVESARQLLAEMMTDWD